MITFITRQTLDHFPKAVSGLSRTLKKTSLGDSWSIESLYDNIVNFEAYAFIQEESGYSGAFTIANSPHKKAIYFFWAGKDPENSVPIDHKEVDEFLVAAARYFNCSQVIAEGRKGWERIIAPFGYKEDSRVYIKEVSHELPEIQSTASDGDLPTTS